VERQAAGLPIAALSPSSSAAFDRATLPWHAGQVLRSGESHGGLVLFRRAVRSTDYGHQARLLTAFWADHGHDWDWLNRIVYLPATP
jgi:hypothetical protein